MLSKLLTVTTSFSLTEPDGDLIPADEVVDSITTEVTSWWERLDLFDKLIGILPSLIVAILTIVIGVICAKVITKILKRALTLKNVDPSTHIFIINVAKLLVYMVFFVSALSKFGFNINSFIAAIGAAGVTAGLGLQQSVSQFASGIQILLNRPFKNGDYIEVGTFAGSVADIHLMYTVLMTVDNKRVIIPNSSITSGSIINYTSENKRRIDLTFNISYTSDIAKAKNVILGLCEKNTLALSDPEPVVYVKAHESSSICLLTRVWCETANYWNLYFQLEESVKLEFDREGIVIPFNQLEVKIVNK